MRTPLLVAPLLLLAACSSGSSGAARSVTASSAPTSTVTAATGGGATTATTPAQTAPRASSGTTAGGSTGSAAVGAPASAAPLSTRAPGNPAASKATPAGTYTYTSSGTVKVGTTPQDASGSQTLTVSPLRNGLQRSTLHSDDTGDTVQEVVVRDTGSYGASLALTSPAFTKEFRPATPVLLLPDPAAIGRRWDWSATSTDGKTHVATTNEVLRRETVTVGGTAVPTVVLQTHLVLSGDVSYDAQLTVWWSPDHRLPVKNHSVGKGSYGGIPFTTDITAVMQSVKPS